MDHPAPADVPPSADSALAPLRSVHTTNLPLILHQLGSSLAITTYQAGKLVIARAAGDVVNTHFRAFNRPMGLAAGPGRLAIGAAVDVWEFRNVPAVAAKLEPPGKHDACFLPRSTHVTGDVQIHEMAYASRSRVSPTLGKRVSEKLAYDDELWFVNTRFSCLAITTIQNSSAARSCCQTMPCATCRKS
jgi:uncharacterized protein (TIGR03032 family)